MLVLSPGRALRNACASLLHRERLGSGVLLFPGSCLAVRERTSWLALWRSQREKRMARRSRRVALSIVAMAGIVVAVLIYWDYRGEIGAERARIASGSQIANTPCGPIEYAVRGSGPPVLLIHGAGGGFDQGLELARPLGDNGFRVIAMSRFGYLRTPLPKDASPEAQADAHACLLNALNLDRVAVVGGSAGAPPGHPPFLCLPTAW